MNIIAGAVFAVVHIAMFADGMTAYPSQCWGDSCLEFQLGYQFAGTTYTIRQT